MYLQKPDTFVLFYFKGMYSSETNITISDNINFVSPQ